MARESPSAKKKEPGNLLLLVLFLLFLLLVYAIFRPEAPRALQPRETTYSVQSVPQTAQPNPYLTASGQLKPRINPDPIESKLIDMFDPGKFAMMEVNPNMSITFDQDMNIVVAFRSAEGKWRIEWIEQSSVLSTGNATHVVYWTFPSSMGRHDIEARHTAALQYLRDSGVLE